MSFQSRDPSTGKLTETFSGHDAGQVRDALERAEDAFRRWRSVSFEDRSRPLKAAADLLRRRKHDYGLLMAREMGKPVVEGEAEAEKCAWVCEYYAENAARFLSPVQIETDARRSYVRFDPLGPVLAVMPWNFPFWQVFRFAAPAVMAGNTALLKHASNVPRCALTIEEIFREAGLPEGVFQTLLIDSRAAEALLDEPVIRAATLTGSEAAGSAVAARAGRRLKKTVLELGGSDPFIVLDDVDVNVVASWAAKARTINAGQSCIAAKRFLVHEAIADPLVAAFRRELEQLPVGDPAEPKTRIGPLAREDLRSDLHRQVEETVRRGAVLVMGGRFIDRPGWFYEPTLLDRVMPGMPAFDQETFGPVAAVTRVASSEEAVELANRSPYGLGASIWSGDADRGEDLVSRIESGSVFVNGIVKSDPRLPFGGVKLSGYGRELADFGIREFVNVKTVWIG